MPPKTFFVDLVAGGLPRSTRHLQPRVPTPEYVILSVAAERKPRLPHSPGGDRRTCSRRQHHASPPAPRSASAAALRPTDSERRLQVLRPPPGLRASLYRRCGGAQDHISSCFDRMGRSGRATKIYADPRRVSDHFGRMLSESAETVS